jgi:hypothetical protein
MAGNFLILVAALAGLVGVPPGEADITDQTAEQDAVYRRERFVYPADARRDPFRPLGVDSGPAFEDLDLVGIIFGGTAGSVATVIDRGTEKRYRVRRGDVIGNARVVEIEPRTVVFRVSEFGVTRNEALKLGRREG